MIYFDAGATTLEKPAAVGRAMAQATHAMSSPGRGSYPASRRAEETAYLCRQEAAELLGGGDDVLAPKWPMVLGFTAAAVVVIGGGAATWWLLRRCTGKGR